MKHLIIGAGNMGKRYADILKRLGQQSELVDIEFNPKKYEKAHDSALICTPPENHANLIGWLPHDLPVFCEKPLTINGFIPRKPANITLVSANWIWCPHLEKEAENITCCYPSKSKYWQWDLIHFYSWFAHNHELIDADAGAINNTAWLLLASKTHKAQASIVNQSQHYTSVEEKRIHSRPCSMYYEQMKHWLAVLRGTVSMNPIEKSLQHHIALGKLLARQAGK